MDFIEFCKLYRVRELNDRLFHARFTIHFRKRRVPEPSVPELGEWIKPLREEANDSQYARCREIERLCALLDYGNLDERKRRQVQRMLRRILKAKECIKTMIKELDATWKDAEHEYEKNKEIQERDKRVSDLYGKNMELVEENEGLKAKSRSAVREKPALWWTTCKIKGRDKRSLQAEFAQLFQRLTNDQNSVKGWHGGDAPFDVIRSGILGELWNKIPENLRTKVYAARDGTFSYESLKRHYQDHLRGTGTVQSDVPHEGDCNATQDSAK